MKIVVILILGYFAIGFFGTGFLIESVTKKPRSPRRRFPSSSC